MWMIAMCNWVDIPPQQKRKGHFRQGNPSFKESPKAIHDLATFAFQMGLESEQIIEIMQHCPDRIIAHNALLEARPQERFAYESTDFDQCRSQIMALFNKATELPTEDVT